MPGVPLSPRRDMLAMVGTAAAVVGVVLVPFLYLAVLAAAGVTMATAAPAGRRTSAALSTWATVSMALVLGTAVAG